MTSTKRRGAVNTITAKTLPGEEWEEIDELPSDIKDEIARLVVETNDREQLVESLTSVLIEHVADDQNVAETKLDRIICVRVIFEDDDVVITAKEVSAEDIDAGVPERPAPGCAADDEGDSHEALREITSIVRWSTVAGVGTLVALAAAASLDLIPVVALGTAAAFLVGLGGVLLKIRDVASVNRA